jgi:ankyrin repeat protein
MESQSEVQSSHNSSETTNVAVHSWDDLAEGQKKCLNWANKQDWDLVKGYAKEHGPEVLFGVYYNKNGLCSVLSTASYYRNVEMVKLTLEAGSNNKEAMYMAADASMRNSDNSTILRLLLEHGLDPNMDLRFEGLVEDNYKNLLMLAATEGHIDHTIALLDHGANVNKIIVVPDGEVLSPLTSTVCYGAHNICRLFLTRGAIPSTNDVHHLFRNCLGACKGEHPNLSRDVAIKMFATFLHLGKPDSDVLRDKFNFCHPSNRDPMITNITKHYLQGRPFCCFVCEALTAKERDKLLMCPCRTVAYCSRECQLKHWKKHKVQCTGPLNERGESEAMVKERHKTGKGAAAGATVVGSEDGTAASGKNGKKGKKGKKGRGKK